MVYKTKILPYFDYPDILCIRSIKRTLTKLQKQQNCALEICLWLGSRAKPNFLHMMAEIELVSDTDRLNSHLLNLVYNDKVHHNILIMLTRHFHTIILDEAKYIYTFVERSFNCKGSWDCD